MLGLCVSSRVDRVRVNLRGLCQCDVGLGNADVRATVLSESYMQSLRSVWFSIRCRFHERPIHVLVNVPPTFVGGGVCMPSLPCKQVFRRRSTITP